MPVPPERRERPFQRRYVSTVELSKPPADLVGLTSYDAVYALVRIRGTPIGVVEQPVADGRCAGTSLRRAALDELRWPITRHLLISGLAVGFPTDGLNLTQFRSILSAPSLPVRTTPSVTVVICTRDRPHYLARCLDAVAALDPVPDEIIVVDNAPRTDAAAAVVERHPSIRRVVEPAAGLDRARSRGAAESRGDIVAYTDDDVVVDVGWIGALRRAFEDPKVDAVTGLVLPLELDTPAQWLFERYGGFGRGFLRCWTSVDVSAGQRAVGYVGAGQFGTGANMAFRRSTLAELGPFDPALDVGTPTNGGGDLEMFYRIVKSGRMLLYDPDVVVWHQHRREYRELREQLTNHGIGFYAYLTRTAMLDRQDRLSVAWFGLRWLVWWNLRRLLQTWFKPGMFPRDLVLAEIAGSFRGPARLRSALQQASDVRLELSRAGHQRLALQSNSPRGRLATVQRVVDVRNPVEGIADVDDYRFVAIQVRRGDERIGQVVVRNASGSLSPNQVRHAIVQELGIGVLGETNRPERERYRAFEAALRDLFPSSSRPSNRPFDPDAAVSVVVATRDRPADLERLLDSLAGQKSSRHVEIVVVDNNPTSGLTPPVAAGRANVRVVPEARAGLSYARNRGILASIGDIVVATDDDVLVPPNWIETLVAPFGDPNVMAVTGNVVAESMATRSERLFEAYGGLGRGDDRMRVDGVWFRDFRRAVPTWRLGGTANAAFRSTIFRDPAIGLLDESLGAGTPTGCSEDTDLFYRILRAGYRIVYEPKAVVRHRHRGTMSALRRQLYAYSKGHVAYQLTTLTREGDMRALVRLAFEMPELYWWRIKTRLTGASDYPLSLVLVEMAGLLAGPFAWWRSRRRVKRLGRSSAPGADSLKCSTS